MSRFLLYILFLYGSLVMCSVNEVNAGA